MIVYADILVVLNLIVDYFLLRLAAVFLKEHPPFWRMFTAALLGAAFSLTALLPRIHTFWQLTIQWVVCTAMAAIGFSGKGIKRLFRRSAVIFAVTYGYAGAMLALWYLFQPSGMLISNSVVYFDISPMFLIAFSAVGYFIAVAARKILSRGSALASECDIKAELLGRSAQLRAMVDTGNSLEDVFGNSEVIIISESSAHKLFGDLEERDRLRSRYRIMPCSTVSGTDMLQGYRCDRALVSHNGVTTEISRPILAVSRQDLGEFDAIVNPRSIE